MRFISSVQGSVALHVSGDEVAPERGVLPKDLMSFLEETYNFPKQNLPTPFPQVVPGQPQLLLQNGVLTKDDQRYPIMQIAILSNGDIVTAQNTEIAEIILDDYITQLDLELGYKLRNAKKTFTYLSNVVVQFDGAIDKHLSVFSEIENIIGAVIQRPEGPFKIKRFAFGQGEPVIPIVPNLEAFDKADFVLERRSNEPYSENKFFSGAPLKLSDHINVLERIEHLLIG